MLRDPVLGAYIELLKGPGNELSDDIVSSLGFDPSSTRGVRIHTDEPAVFLCEFLNARAFAYGVDIFFNEGEYDTGSAEGKKLLAHELAHVAKQQVTNLSFVERQPKQTNQNAKSSLTVWQTSEEQELIIQEMLKHFENGNTARLMMTYGGCEFSYSANTANSTKRLART